MKNIILILLLLMFFTSVYAQVLKSFDAIPINNSSTLILKPNFDKPLSDSIYNSHYRVKNMNLLGEFVKNTLKRALSPETRAKVSDETKFTLQIFFNKSGNMFYGQFSISQDVLPLFSEDELLKIYKEFQKQPLDMNNIDLRQPDEGKTFTFGILNIFISPKLLQ